MSPANQKMLADLAENCVIELRGLDGDTAAILNEMIRAGYVSVTVIATLKGVMAANRVTQQQNTKRMK